MTDEQIIAIRKATRPDEFTPFADAIAFARAIEQAVKREHGIPNDYVLKARE